MEVLYELFDGLPRQGPGSDAATRQAWELLGTVAPQPTLLTIGCGSGMEVRELARLSRGRVLALDNYQPYLDTLQHHAARENLTEHIETINGSMDAMPFAPGTFDVIWSEGAIYVLGFEQGLATCKPLLKPQGYLVFSDLAWFTDNPAPELVQFWQDEQIAVYSVAEKLHHIEQAGYRCLGHFPLPQAAWWDDFYSLIEARIAPLQQKYRHDPERLAIVNNQQREIDLYRTYADQYGYVFYAMQA